MYKGHLKGEYPSIPTISVSRRSDYESHVFSSSSTVGKAFSFYICSLFICSTQLD